MTLNRSSCTGRVLSVFVIIFGGNLCVFLDFNAIQYIKLPFKNQWLIGSNFRNSHKYMVLYNSETFLHNRLHSSPSDASHSPIGTSTSSTHLLLYGTAHWSESGLRRGQG